MPTRRLVLHALARTALLLAWALVGWGTLLLVSAVASAIDERSPAAFTRLLPASGAGVWGWLAPFSTLLAVTVGLAAVALLVARRRERGIGPQQ